MSFGNGSYHPAAPNAPQAKFSPQGGQPVPGQAYPGYVQQYASNPNLNGSVQYNPQAGYYPVAGYGQYASTGYAAYPGQMMPGQAYGNNTAAFQYTSPQTGGGANPNLAGSMHPGFQYTAQPNQLQHSASHPNMPNMGGSMVATPNPMAGSYHPGTGAYGYPQQPQPDPNAGKVVAANPNTTAPVSGAYTGSSNPFAMSISSHSSNPNANSNGAENNSNANDQYEKFRKAEEERLQKELDARKGSSASASPSTSSGNVSAAGLAPPNNNATGRRTSAPGAGVVGRTTTPTLTPEEEDKRFQLALEMRMKEEEEKMRKKIEAEVRAEQFSRQGSSGALQQQMDPEDAEYFRQQQEKQQKIAAETENRRQYRFNQEAQLRQSVAVSRKMKPSGTNAPNPLGPVSVGVGVGSAMPSAAQTLAVPGERNKNGPRQQSNYGQNYFNRTIKQLRQDTGFNPTASKTPSSSRAAEEERMRAEKERMVSQAIEKFKQEELERLKLQVVSSFRQEEMEKIRLEMETQFEREKAERVRQYEEDRRNRDKAARWEIEPSEIQLGKLLGKGAFGEVFRAKLHGKEVAVKKLTAQDLDEEVLADFRREVDIMLNLHHPNILLFMGACTRGGQLMIVTEFMPRGSVDDLIHNSQLDLPLQKRLQFGKECALGMNWLHSLKPIFLHLDLKPANLLVDYNWTVKIADFGMSQIKVAGDPGGGGIVGSPFYMAPEILLEKDFDEKVDVYSFAIVLWELVTRLEPYEGKFKNFDELIDGVGIERLRPRLPAECPFQLKNLITACWDHDPHKRPSFENICAGNTFDNIIVHMTILEHAARDFWKKCFLEKSDVPWRQYWSSWRDEFQIRDADVPDTDARVKSFKEVLCSRVDPDKVFMENVNDYFYWFGPLEKTTEGAKKCLDKAAYLLSQKWFHGELGQEEAERLLNRQRRGTLFVKEEGFWLVRFGKTGHFYFSVKNENKTFTHMEIKNSSGVLKIGNKHCANFDDVLNHAKKELKVSLKNFVPSGRYESIFPGASDTRKVVSWA